MPAPEKVAAFLAEQAKKIHGGGGKKYRDQHFMMTYSGVMYEEDDKESEKMERVTYGTYAHRNLASVAEDLRSRLDAVLNEGQTPRTVGPASKYGYFANGITEAAVMVMERAEQLDMDPGARVKAEYVGSREIDGEPYLDVRTKDGIFVVPAGEAGISRKPREGEKFEIRMLKSGVYKFTKK